MIVGSAGKAADAIGVPGAPAQHDHRHEPNPSDVRDACSAVALVPEAPRSV